MVIRCFNFVQLQAIGQNTVPTELSKLTSHHVVDIQEEETQYRAF
jgi:hypothetical protein